MTFELFAEQLAERAQRVLPFKEAAALAADRYKDVGETPRTGDAAKAMTHVVAALQAVRDPFNVGRLLLYAGYLAEQGAPTREAARVAAERLGSYMSSAAMAVRNTQRRDLMAVATDIATLNPRAASAILIIDAAVPGAMTLLVREREALRAVRRDPEVLRNVQTVATFAKVASFLVALLESSDNQTMTIIQPSHKHGVEVVADNVRNGFHLFTLLEAALLGATIQGPPVPLAEVAIARGEVPLTDPHEFRARFDYFNWSAWGQGGFVADAPTRWIWGELPLRAIPRVKDLPVVLIDDPRYVRTWDGGLIARVHPDARSGVTVTRTLTEADVVEWLELLESAPEAARDQMKYAGVKLDS